MWSVSTGPTGDARTLRFDVLRAGVPASCAEVLHAWEHDAAFREFFIGILAAVPFSAFRWETPPVTSASVNRPFEFAVLDSPGLAARPDARAFADHFKAGKGASVVTFPNLGRDAILVVPCPVGHETAYGHLAAFVREAPVEQQHELWRQAGCAMEKRIGSAPVWLSTAGAGVAWLHVRLDDRPKYYGHAPYREGERVSRER